MANRRRTSSLPTRKRGAAPSSPHQRRLALERLEDRRLLTIMVNTLIDEADHSIIDGDISLRDAIEASPAGGTIDFSVTGTINLALGAVVVQDRIIHGPGAAQLTINAHGASNVFTTRGTTTLSGLTITGGGSSLRGGGIRNEGNGHLTVTDSVITGNTAYQGGGINAGGAMLDYGSVTVRNSTISGNHAIGNFIPGDPQGRYGIGGGIYTGYSYVTVDKSTISGNSANEYGGGIYGGVTMTSSTVSGNDAGVGTFGEGAGIFTRGSLSIVNSTISGNLGSGIRFVNGSGGVVANSTITDNKWGIVAYGGATLLNTIVAGNGVDKRFDITGTVDVSGSRNNLIGNSSNPDANVGGIGGPPAGGLTNGVNGNIVGAAFAGLAGALDPGLGPLANNGGPTKTHALFSFSPAVNAGLNSLIPIDPSTGLPFATDQTGAPRRFGGGTVDMGAVEVQGAVVPSTVVNTATDDVGGNALTSLREAIGFALTLGGPVTFDPTVFATPQTIPLVHGEIKLFGRSAPLVINGPGRALATVDGEGAPVVFKNYGTTTLSGLTITGANFHDLQLMSWGDGSTVPTSGQHLVVAGADTSGLLHIRTFDFNGVRTDTYEAMEGGQLHLVSVDASGNVLSDVRESSLPASQTQAIADLKQQLPSLLPPHVLSQAEKAQVLRKAAVITGVNFVGAIHNKGALTISASAVSDNQTRAIFNEGDVNVVDSIISGNSADRGAAIFVFNNVFAEVVSISNSVISGNTATDRGGGLYSTGPVTIANSTISGNTASDGGGIYQSSGATSTLSIMGTYIHHNSAAFGGGISLNTTATIANSTIASNTAGGGLSGGRATIINSTISGNSGSGIGGGQHMIINSTIANNTGAGLSYVPGSTVLNSIIAGNTAGNVPSDVFGNEFLNPFSAYNLIGDATTSGGLVNGANGNIVGVNPALVIGPLADNGGPTLPGGAKLLTHALLPGSPAIDAGDPYFNSDAAQLPLDERGGSFDRVVRTKLGVTNDYVGLAEVKFGASGGQVITPVAAFASSYYSTQQSPTNLVNGSGLNTSSGNVLTYTHAPDPTASGMWHAGAGQGIGGAAPIADDQYVVLDLGANYNLSNAYLWQMVQQNLLGRGLKEFRLLASPSAPNPTAAANPPAVYDLTGFIEILGVTQLAASGQAAAAPTQAFALTGATNVRTIYLDVISSYNTGARVDIGAFELQGTPAALQGDYNQNHSVDAADYVLWRKTRGATGVTPYSSADGDGNGSVQSADYGVWRSHFGQSLPAAGTAESNAAAGQLAATTSAEVATSITGDTAKVATTPDEGGDAPANIAKPAVGSPSVLLVNAKDSPRARARKVAATTSGDANALQHDSALLAWLSSSRLYEVPPNEVMRSNWHSHKDATQADSSESNSIDVILADLANARSFDF